MKVIRIDSCLHCPFSRGNMCKDKNVMLARFDLICHYSDKTIKKGFNYMQYDEPIPEWCELEDEWDEYDKHYERSA